MHTPQRGATGTDRLCLYFTAVWYEDWTLEEEGYSIQVDGVEDDVRSRLKSENFKGEL